ncbi:MAG TPA: VWA domain-containing protein [Chthoniobacterales bacterium]
MVADLEAEVAAEPPAKRRAKWWRSRPFLFISVGAHLLFGILAACLVVSKYSAGRKLTFSAGPKSPNPSERALQHRVQMQEKVKAAPAAVPKRVLTAGAAKVQLPAMPSIPDAHTGPPTPRMAAAGGASFGAPGGSGGSVGGTGSGSQINFFGIKDKSSSIVIMVDVSDSMFGRTGDYDYESKKLVKQGKDQSFQAVRDEAIKLVESLGPAVSFGIVRWSGGAYSWKPELVPATDENKKAAIEHIQTKLDIHTSGPNKGRPGGTRHDYALVEAFALKPDVIYMITDGNATAAQPGGGRSEAIPPEQIFKVVDEGQKTLAKRAKIHVVYYVTGKEKADERQMLMNLAARTSGRFNKVDARGRRQ